MDYSLAAVKLMCFQLKSARPTPSQNAFTFGGIIFQRAWLQGILISEHSFSDDGEKFDDRYFIDDGTGVVELFLSGEFGGRNWETGMYVMVVGAYLVLDDDGFPMIKVHKLVDLSPFPDREPMWYLEVIEAFKLFYKPLTEG